MSQNNRGRKSKHDRPLIHLAIIFGACRMLDTTTTTTTTTTTITSTIDNEKNHTDIIIMMRLYFISFKLSLRVKI